MEDEPAMQAPCKAPGERVLKKVGFWSSVRGYTQGERMKRAGLLFMLLLAGCADWQALEAKQTKKYVGGPIDRVYEDYGAPIGVAPTTDGGKFMEFQTTGTAYECTAKVRVSPSGIVRSIKVGGMNGCATPF